MRKLLKEEKSVSSEDVKIPGLTPGYSSQTVTSGLQEIHGLQLLISLTPE